MYSLKESSSLSANLVEVQALLELVGLKMPQDWEHLVSLYDGTKLIGIGFLVGEILQGIGVHPEYKGEGLAATLVTTLLKRALALGRERLFIFTKPQEAHHFLGLGFKRIAEAKPYAALLEWGSPGIEEYKAILQESTAGIAAKAACIVVNCNPFTLGHRYLIEQAAQENGWLYIIVVEEEKSLFPFRVRYELIRKGTADLANVTLIPGDKYVISSLTFPAYFTRERDLTAAQTSLDLEVFAHHIAPVLNIKKRYVGEEPLCPVTSVYNKYMQEILPKYGIEVEVVRRLEKNGLPVSASRVRDLIRAGKIAETKELLPETTYTFLISAEAQGIIKKIKNTNTRH